jgi:hypothetical protein
MKNSAKKRNAGMALTMVVLFIVVMSIIGVTMVSIAMASSRNAAVVPAFDTVHYTAEAAMTRAMPGFAAYLSTPLTDSIPHPFSTLDNPLPDIENHHELLAFYVSRSVQTAMAAPLNQLPINLMAEAQTAMANNNMVAFLNAKIRHSEGALVSTPASGGSFINPAANPVIVNTISHGQGNGIRGDLRELFRLRPEILTSRYITFDDGDFRLDGYTRFVTTDGTPGGQLVIGFACDPNGRVSAYNSHQILDNDGRGSFTVTMMPYVLVEAGVGVGGAQLTERLIFPIQFTVAYGVAPPAAPTGVDPQGGVAYWKAMNRNPTGALPFRYASFPLYPGTAHPLNTGAPIDVVSGPHNPGRQFFYSSIIHRTWYLSRAFNYTAVGAQNQANVGGGSMANAGNDSSITRAGIGSNHVTYLLLMQTAGDLGGIGSSGYRDFWPQWNSNAAIPHQMLSIIPTGSGARAWLRNANGLLNESPVSISGNVNTWLAAPAAITGHPAGTTNADVVVYMYLPGGRTFTGTINAPYLRAVNVTGDLTINGNFTGMQFPYFDGTVGGATTFLVGGRMDITTTGSAPRNISNAEFYVQWAINAGTTTSFLNGDLLGNALYVSRHSINIRANSGIDVGTPDVAPQFVAAVGWSSAATRPPGFTAGNPAFPTTGSPRFMDFNMNNGTFHGAFFSNGWNRVRVPLANSFELMGIIHANVMEPADGGINEGVRRITSAGGSLGNNAIYWNSSFMQLLSNRIDGNHLAANPDDINMGPTNYWGLVGGNTNFVFEPGWATIDFIN